MANFEKNFNILTLNEEAFDSVPTGRESFTRFHGANYAYVAEQKRQGKHAGLNSAEYTRGPRSVGKKEISKRYEILKAFEEKDEFEGVVDVNPSWYNEDEIIEKFYEGTLPGQAEFEREF